MQTPVSFAVQSLIHFVVAAVLGACEQTVGQ